ncbi:hypothetical protein PPL_00045 [Heterostelium album PN500]|uniref:Right handed beta helix domain-containing protein n=1 Tax=Heterostelium pallidum (strain ATCC 26659 / Pp 5 / PN500) TaxID=670386 RepID=D3BVP4_HETP5|nr:hypothetical protein PPL_00045 [Heterostelium album PN500]EFA74547.1 hypothetical protein PPL_00045 [Heterostelium album PN500]|eukprot:XP_020426681.1 hypothetical protein PPL_00045 [Heterostelium album PN500]
MKIKVSYINFILQYNALNKIENENETDICLHRLLYLFASIIIFLYIDINITINSGVSFYCQVGAIRLSDNTKTKQFNAIRSKFINCTSADRGSLFFDAGSIHMDNCAFENNTTYIGGALYTKWVYADISNSIFISNIANIDGGGLMFISKRTRRKIN